MTTLPPLHALSLVDGASIDAPTHPLEDGEEPIKKQRKKKVECSSAPEGFVPSFENRRSFGELFAKLPQGELKDEDFVYLKAGNPIAKLGSNPRGEFGEQIVQHYLEGQNYNVVRNNDKRNNPFDLFVRRKDLPESELVRVEVKLASMSWSGSRYELSYQELHPENHDQCFLVFNGLGTLHIFDYGKAEKDRDSWVGPTSKTKTLTVEDAEFTILTKMKYGKEQEAGTSASRNVPDVDKDGRPIVNAFGQQTSTFRVPPRTRLVKTYAINDPVVAGILEALNASTLTGTMATPLELLTDGKIGVLAESLVPFGLRELGYNVTKPISGTDYTEKPQNAPFDLWITHPGGQGRLATEMKTSGGDKPKVEGDGWFLKFSFGNIKPEKHQLRLLNVIMPEGIYCFFHTNNALLTKKGKFGVIVQTARAKSVQAVRECILYKMQLDCDRVPLFIAFQPGDLEAMQARLLGTSGAGSSTQHAALPAVPQPFLK